MRPQSYLQNFSWSGTDQEVFTKTYKNKLNISHLSENSFRVSSAQTLDHKPTNFRISGFWFRFLISRATEESQQATFSEYTKCSHRHPPNWIILTNTFHKEASKAVFSRYSIASHSAAVILIFTVSRFITFSVFPRDCDFTCSREIPISREEPRPGRARQASLLTQIVKKMNAMSTTHGHIFHLSAIRKVKERPTNL